MYEAGGLVERRSILDVTRWRVAFVSVAMLLSLIVLVMLVAQPDPADGPTGDAASSTAAPPAATEVVAATSSAPPAATAISASIYGSAEPAAAPTVAAAAPPAPEPTSVGSSTVATSPPPNSPRPVPDVRLEIPAIGVNAWVIRMGLDQNGVMEVPRNAQLVAWYDFTSVPGAPGNAVMSAHLDYRGSTAVFWRLGDLTVGDRISVILEGESVDYVVSNIYSTRPEDADLREIIGGRTGATTLTLITCGGIWDAAEGEYDQRVIVQAKRVV